MNLLTPRIRSVSDAVYEDERHTEPFPGNGGRGFTATAHHRSQWTVVRQSDVAGFEEAPELAVTAVDLVGGRPPHGHTSGEDTFGLLQSDLRFGAKGVIRVEPGLSASARVGEPRVRWSAAARGAAQANARRGLCRPVMLPLSMPGDDGVVIHEVVADEAAGYVRHDEVAGGGVDRARDLDLWLSREGSALVVDRLPGRAAYPRGADGFVSGKPDHDVDHRVQLYGGPRRPGQR
jgi:hypothetical protein